MEYEFRRITPTDVPDICRLFSASFNSELSEQALTRKLDTKDFGAAYVGYLAIAPNSEIAAYYAVYPVRMRINDTLVLAAQSGDTMTHPEHQKKGLFLQLAELCYQLAEQQGIQLVFGFPNQNSKPGFIKHLQWQLLRPMEGLELHASVPAWRRRFARWTHNPDAKVWARMQPLVVSDGLSFDDASDGVLKDQTYLGYKASITQSVVINYGPLTVWCIPGLRIDIGAFTENQTLASEELRDAFIQLMQFSGAHSARFCMNPQSEAFAKLSPHGVSGSPVDVGYRLLDDSLTIRDLYFTRGDFDYF